MVSLVDNLVAGVTYVYHSNIYIYSVESPSPFSIAKHLNRYGSFVESIHVSAVFPCNLLKRGGEPSIFTKGTRFSRALLVLQSKYLPQQPKLPKRSLAPKQCRSSLVPIVRLLNLLAQPLIRVRQPLQRGMVHPIIERLNRESSEARRVYDPDVREPNGESVQSHLEGFGLCSGDPGHRFLCESWLS